MGLFWKRVAIAFLLFEGGGAALWWAGLLLVPAIRPLFMAQGAPEVVLLAFSVPDGLLFIATAIAAAIGLLRCCAWTYPVLCIHSGAAMYAALYCWMLTFLTGGDALPGALLMTPSLFVPAILAVNYPRYGGAPR